MQKFSLIAAFFCLVLVISCTKDQSEPEPPPCDSAFGYMPDIQPILQTNCTYSGCHDGSGATKYDTYELLKVALDNGSFNNRVLTLGDMPPDYATGPTSLTAEEIETIRMWVLAGAAETPSEVDVTYENGIGELMITRCATSGCHDGTAGAPRNYNFYDEIKVHIDNGSFVDRVVTIKSNPVRGMPPSDRAEVFTPEEFELVKCWIDKGFPE